MKDIEFRAKSMEYKDWISGYLVKGETGNYYICKNLSHAFIWVDEKTIGQYTGLKDENDIMIFENDIVNFTYDVFTGDFDTVDGKGIVKFYDGAFYIAPYQKDGKKIDSENEEWFLLYHVNLDAIEVIGNIYDESDVK